MGKAKIIYNYKYFTTTKSWITGLTGDEFKFNQHGDGPARYNIIHYKQLSKGNFQWITVGNFYDEEMELNMDGKHWRRTFLPYVEFSVLLCHSSERRSLCSTFCPREILQNLLCFLST